MSDKKTYDVHRSMHGDGRDYGRGDTREMTEADAVGLVATGALSLKGQKPVEPTPAVEHTFGTAPSELNENGFTVAAGEGVKLPTSAKAAKPKA